MLIPNQACGNGAGVHCRMLYGFSRDRAVPFWWLWQQVDDHGVPVHAGCSCLTEWCCLHQQLALYSSLMLLDNMLSDNDCDASKRIGIVSNCSAHVWRNNHVSHT